MSETRDGWAKFDIVAKAFAALALPLIIGYLGLRHNAAQQEASRRDLALRDSIAALERQADRLTRLLDQLSSDSPRRRLMAIRVAEQLGAHNQLPIEIVPVLSQLAQANADSIEGKAARSAVATAAAADSARRDDLIRRLFSDDARSRILASEALVPSAERDTLMVPALLRHTSGQMTNANGVFNTLGVLVQICPTHTRKDSSRIASFIADVRRSPVTGERIRALTDSLARCK